jgi:hypothetical protein
MGKSTILVSIVPQAGAACPPCYSCFSVGRRGRHVPQAGAACPPCLWRGLRVSFREFLVPVVRLAHVVGLGSVLVSLELSVSSVATLQRQVGSKSQKVSRSLLKG